MLLIEHLGFEHPRQNEVDRSRWPDEWREYVRDARFVAERAGFRVALITVAPEVTLRTWRAVATRILLDYEGMGLICIHSRGGTRWLWSSASLEHRRTAAILAEGIRHITVELEPDGDAPAGFLTLLSEMEVTAAGSALEVLTKVSGAFDQYTAELHADIGENTFEALRWLSDGLLSRSENRLKRDVATLERIRPEVFILLYRLLFILYAEAREIFPVSHPVYRERYSLQWWRENVTLPLEAHGDAALRPFGGESDTELWHRCRGLFHLIKSGSNALGHKPEEFSFRPYYGTIFDDEIHPDLEAWEIPNGPLGETLRALTRFREESGSIFFVDYSSLEIRHLGSIYEGLLEYHLAIDRSGKVAHTLNRRDRKSTGSYFTPPALIERVVAGALDPILERVQVGLDDRTPGAFEKAVYALKVCDPAMGSGHFLVGVLNHLTRSILHSRHGASVSQASLEEAVEVKRTLVRHCLYGVDKNHLAVELAKMSLWLETADSNRPLSFLDAHLKSGDSLVGSDFKSLEDPQRSLLGEDIRDHLRDEVRNLVALERQEEIDAVDVMNKVHQYRRLRSTRTRYGRLAQLLDTQVSSLFGAVVEDWRNARGLLRKPEEFDAFVRTARWQEVEMTAGRIGFFHWELEFPEIFYTENGHPRRTPGFDAIVGNPPYVFGGSRGISQEEKLYFKATFSVGTGKVNLFTLFIERSLALVGEGRMVSFVLPNTFLRVTSYATARKLVLTHAKVREIIDLGNEVFPDATTSSVIVALEKGGDIANHSTIIRIGLEGKSSRILQTEFLRADNVIAIRSSPEEVELSDKIQRHCVPLGELCKELIFGVVISKNQSQVVGATPKRGWMPFLEGKDIDRYLVKPTSRFLHYVPSLLHRPRTKGVFEVPEKLLVQRITGGKRPLAVAYDNRKYYTKESINNIILKNTAYSAKYILALLNSSLLNWYYKTRFTNESTLTVNLSKTYLSRLPIRSLDFDNVSHRTEHDRIVSLADRLLLAAGNIQVGENPSERASSEAEFRRLDLEMDQFVYALYGLTPSERELIERALSPDEKIERIDR